MFFVNLVSLEPKTNLLPKNNAAICRFVIPIIRGCQKSNWQWLSFMFKFNHLHKFRVHCFYSGLKRQFSTWGTLYIWKSFTLYLASESWLTKLPKKLTNIIGFEFSSSNLFFTTDLIQSIKVSCDNFQLVEAYVINQTQLWTCIRFAMDRKYQQKYH